MKQLYDLPEKIQVSRTAQPSGNITKYKDGMKRIKVLPMNDPRVLRMLLDRVYEPIKRKKAVVIDLVSKLRKAK